MSAHQWVLLDRRGYTLIEVIVVMIIISVIAAVSLKSLRHIDTDARYQETLTTMDDIAQAVAGDPSMVSGGCRTDYGYVGDVGSLPANLDALVSNPGYGTWDGPYLDDRYYASAGASAASFKQDAWGNPLSYSGGVTISSSGGSGLTRNIASSGGELLSNQVTAVITDRDYSPPGATYQDSVKLVLTYPNGSGGYTNANQNPDAGGFLEFSSVPIGSHTLRLVYEPTNDTLTRIVNVDPGTSRHVDFRYYAEVWSDTSGSGGGGGGIEYVSGTGTAAGGDCDEVHFEITNTSASAITVISLTMTWSSPTAYYKRIRWDSDNVFNSSNPRSGPGDVSAFTISKQIDPGDTVQIEIEDYCENVSASCGNEVNMGGGSFTVDFSDGSSLDFTIGVCP